MLRPEDPRGQLILRVRVILCSSAQGWEVLRGLEEGEKPDETKHGNLDT